jgi:potassium-transporting ATPase KdpC subunit
MRRQLLPALGMIVVFTVITGLLYPLAVTGVAQGLFDVKAKGSLVEVDGRPVGSSLIGQSFTLPEYFHPRPSAAGDGYDGSASSASNLGPASPELLSAVTERVDAYRREYGLDEETPVPVDAVTASSSGLDPHISVANAKLQAPRVAEARNIDLETVLRLVRENTATRGLGFLGEPGVNVLLLNIALDSSG